MYYNSYEIDEMVETIERRAPEAAPFARYLADWRDIVNDNSDGWAHWQAGRRCADKLTRLLSMIIDTMREGGSDLPERKELERALSPIKSMATRRGLPVPILQDQEPHPAP